MVKERRDLKLDSLQVGPIQEPPPSGPSAGSPQEMPIPNLQRLSAADRSLLREYSLRRPSLEGPAASEVASHLAAAFAQKLDYDLAGEAPELFLSRLSRQIEGR